MEDHDARGVEVEVPPQAHRNMLVHKNGKQ